MREEQFKSYLAAIVGKNGVATRLTKARNAETILETNLDTIVADDDLMFNALVRLQDHDDPRKNPMQNALRHYYTFCNGREFPLKKEYAQRREEG